MTKFTTGETLVSSLQLGTPGLSYPTNAQLTPDGSQLYVTVNSAGTGGVDAVVVVNTAGSMSITATLDEGPSPMMYDETTALAVTAAAAYIGNPDQYTDGSWSIMVICNSDHSVSYVNYLETNPNGGYQEGIGGLAMSADGSTAYVADNYNGVLSQVTNAGEVASTYDSAFYNATNVFLTGATGYVTRGNNQLIQFNTSDLSEGATLTVTGGSFNQPTARNAINFVTDGSTLTS